MPGTLVLCLTSNTTSGVSCRVGGRTFCHIFLDFFCVFLFFILQMLTTVLALHWGFCPFTDDEAPSMLRARCVKERRGLQWNAHICTRALCLRVWDDDVSICSVYFPDILAFTLQPQCHGFLMSFDTCQCFVIVRMSATSSNACQRSRRVRILAKALAKVEAKATATLPARASRKEVEKGKTRTKVDEEEALTTSQTTTT